MNAFAKERRKKVIKVLREDGARAYHEGKPVTSAPRTVHERTHWLAGWEDAKRETERERDDPAEAED